MGRPPHRAGSLAAALLATIAMASSSLAQGNAPVVTNVVAQQVQGTGLVDVTFDVSDADGDSVTISVIFSSNNGVAFDLLPRTITGDVNKRIATGTGKSIVWDAAADYPGFYWPEVVAKVIANDGQITAGEMVLVPSGTFVRGGFNIGTQTVFVDSFYIDKYEVTNAEYSRFIDADGYATPAYWSTEGWSRRQANNWTAPLGWNTSPYVGNNYPGFPVSGVSWYEAEAYANFVGKRLLTEAEWEKAARGTSTIQYPWGNQIDNRRANWLNSTDPNDNFPTPVGYFNGTLYQGLFQSVDSPSPYGAYDLAGNIEEWVRDWWNNANSYPSVPTNNPIGPSSGDRRIVRGGSFLRSESYMVTDSRSSQYPDRRYGVDGSVSPNGMGFRLGKPVIQ